MALPYWKRLCFFCLIEKSLIVGMTDDDVETFLATWETIPWRSEEAEAFWGVQYTEPGETVRSPEGNKPNTQGLEGNVYECLSAMEHITTWCVGKKTMMDVRFRRMFPERKDDVMAVLE